MVSDHLTPKIVLRQLPLILGIISELQAITTTWGEARRKAQDRTRWKETVLALCPPWDEVE
jgi:hypothetical protein